jgi:polysaccharide chain length determinant protein (PEP-CTERM system associated)
LQSSGKKYEAIDKLRSKITLKVKHSGNSWNRTPSSFEITFEGRNPKQVQDVTSAITRLYIDHNYRLRAEQAAGTLKFLDRELVRMKEALRQKEEAVREFKEKHIGLLPEQMENNYRILAQLQQHLDSINTALQKTEDRKILLQTQLTKLESLNSQTLAEGDRAETPLTIEGLRRELRRLQSRYSDRHPDVIKLQARIAKLETEKQISESETISRGYQGSQHSNEAQKLVHFQKDDRHTELRLIDKELLSLRKEKDQIQSQIEGYRRRIESGPKIEQMFVDLHRDYEQASQNYQSLLKKKLQAELAENLERTQKGEQFKVLDAANLPREPSKPNIPRILAVGFVLALGCGFGSAFLREYLDPTFWSRKDVENVLELPVLVAIPNIQTDQERRWRMVKRAAKVCALLVMSSGLGYAMYLLWKKSPGFIPLPL